MKEATVFIVCIVILSIITFGVMPDKLRNLKVSLSGTKVEATIVEFPKYGRNHRYDIKFRYGRREFYYGMPETFYEEYSIGDTFVFLHNPCYPNIYVTQGGPGFQYLQIFSTILMFIFTSVCFFYRKRIAKIF